MGLDEDGSEYTTGIGGVVTRDGSVYFTITNDDEQRDPTLPAHDICIAGIDLRSEASLTFIAWSCTEIE